ncbi:MAG TPA: tetratricopeptide repeat protein [Phycisphaerae bacterium]|nr:tetratricopeptide repeat protein [Phycisphaerae bacterium]
MLLNEAQRAFDRGAEMRVNDPDQAISVFREAADKFQLIVDSGIRNGRLYYNLANARLESGRLGRAIADYRRAQRLLPNDGRVEHNLSYARSLRRDQIEFTGRQAFLETLFFWHYHTSSSLRFTSALACYLLFWLLLIARTFFRQWRWRYLLLPTLVLWLILGCSVAVDMHAQAAYSGGVLTADNVIVRKGNGEGFEPQFKQTLNEGVEFSVLERRGDWLHIELPDGKTGWIRADQAEII